MEKPKFEFYTRPNGHNEFLEFLESLTELKLQYEIEHSVNP